MNVINPFGENMNVDYATAMTLINLGVGYAIVQQDSAAVKRARTEYAEAGPSNTADDQEEEALSEDPNSGFFNTIPGFVGKDSL